jgi:PAS domain S-box-containing protein
VNLRILFVEDSPDDVEFMLRRLRAAGIEPQWQRVETADALREALAGEHWQVALVDFNLPSFSGPEALALLAELAPDVPAITVSGAISEETAVATISAGAVDYILKDNLTRLAPAVLRAVEGAELRARQRRAAAQARQTQYAIDHSSQVIFYISEDGTILYVNEAAKRFGGGSPADAVGEKIWGWSPAVDEARWAELWRAAAQAPIVDFEAAVRLPSGEERLVSATLDYHERDADPFIIVYARDITAQRAVEERAAVSEALYRRIVEMASEGIWAMDGACRTTLVNPQMAAMLGYESGEMLGREVTDFMFQEDLNVHGVRMGERGQGQPGHYQRRFRRKDGGEVWTSVFATAELGPQGEFLGSFGMFTDITESKQAEEELRFTRFVVEHAGDAVFWMTAGGAFRYANPLTCERLGYSLDELRTMTIRSTSRSSSRPVRSPSRRITAPRTGASSRSRSRRCISRTRAVSTTSPSPGTSPSANGRSKPRYAWWPCLTRRPVSWVSPMPRIPTSSTSIPPAGRWSASRHRRT